MHLREVLVIPAAPLWFYSFGIPFVRNCFFKVLGKFGTLNVFCVFNSLFYALLKTVYVQVS